MSYLRKLKVLQVIENLVIGGAQRTATTLMKLKVFDLFDFYLATYDTVHQFETEHFDVLLIHVWCTTKDGDAMNWHEVNISYDQLIVFNHDWKGSLCYGADKYVVYSKFAANNIRSDGKVYILPGGISIEEYKDIQRNYKSSKDLVLGRLSTMHPGKISTDTLQFWTMLPYKKYMVGGSGIVLQDLLNCYGNDPRFYFSGEIRPRNVPSFLAAIDIFVYDTNWHIESFCYVVLEAMAAGCVVVAKKKGAVQELIRHKETGFLYDSEEEAINWCNRLFNDEYLRSKVSENARAFADSFSIESLHSNLLSIIKSA